MKISKQANQALSFLWLFAGLTLLYFSFLKNALPLAAWLAPAFIMRFTRTQKKGGTLAVGCILIILAFILIWIPVMKMLNPLVMLALIGGEGGLFIAALLLDRAASRRLSGIASTFVFPLTWTIIEYARSFIESSGSHGSLAYSQFGFLPIMQFASIAGIWGITFLICWLAPTANLILENGRNWKKSRGAAAVFLCAFALILSFGLARVGLNRIEGGTLRVATVTKNRTTQEFALIYGYRTFRPMDEYSRLIDAYSTQAAAKGAKALLWQEYFFQIPADSEQALLGKLSAAAKRTGTYQITGAVLYDATPGGKARNKAIVIAPDGRVVLEYVKRHLVVGLETGRQFSGDGIIKTLQTESGLWAVSICYDNDFPQYISQAGRAGADILFIPSLEWPEIVPFHSYMAIFRGVENGCSTVKVSGYGLTTVADSRGRILASQDDGNTEGKILIAEVPIRGTRTVYSAIGDSLVWAGMGALAILLALAFRKPKK